MPITLSKGRYFPAIATLVIAGTVTVAALKAVADEHCRFADIPESSGSDVVYACQQGWFEGYPDGTFQPDRRILQHQIATVINRVFPTGATRADMAAFLRGGNPGDPAGPAGFSDVPPAHPQHQDIAYAKERGWFTGYPDGNFRPGKPITPAQIVTVLQRAFSTGSTRADLASFMRNGNQALTTTTYQLSNDIGTWAWSPTRDQIAYTTTVQDAEGNELNELRVTTTDGSVTRKLYDTIHDIRTFSWSPGGDKIAYVVVVRDAKGERLREGLLVVSTKGSSQSILTELVTIKSLKWANASPMWIVDGAYPISYTVGDIIWSPRGEKIAFTVATASNETRGTGRIELWVAEADSSATPTIINEGAIYSLYRRIEWSSDGNYLAYTVYTSDERELWITGADGSNTQKLSNQTSNWQWSPNGDNIAYWVNNELWVTGADGSSTQQLSNVSGGLQWSPSGDQIAYTVGVSDAQDNWRSELWITEPDGSNTRELSNQSGRWKWSPDGEHIAYIDQYPEGDLWVVNVDNLNKAKLSSNTRYERYLRWSPDGQRIAYTKFSAEQRLELWVSEIDRSNALKISNDISNNSGMIWSPNGDHIVFIVSVRLTQDRWRRELWVTGADGSNTRRLSNQISYWKWSPGGNHIAYTLNIRNGQGNVGKLWITKVN